MKTFPAGAKKRWTAATSLILLLAALKVFTTSLLAQQARSSPTPARTLGEGAPPAAEIPIEPAEGRPRFDSGPGRGRALGTGSALPGLSSQPSSSTQKPPADIAPARFEATVYEVRVPENRVADLDARALEAKAATAQSLLKALTELGPSKVLYRVDQTVNLFGESITIGRNEPMVTGTHTTPRGELMNTVSYHTVGLIINISANPPPEESKRKGLDTQLKVHLAVMSDSGVDMVTNVKAPSIRNLELSHSETPQFGKPCVQLAVSGASSDGAAALPTAYIVRYRFSETTP